MKTLFTFLVFIFFFTTAEAQDINATIGGNTSNEEFSVKDNVGTTLFRVGGDGNVSIGTTTTQFNAKLEVVDRINVIGTGRSQIFLAKNGNEYLDIQYDALFSRGLISTGNSSHPLILQNIGGSVGIGTTSPMWTLDVIGLIGGGGLLYHSDIRWKKNVQSLTNSLEKITMLRGVNFEWRRDEFSEMNFTDGTQIGLIAQEVEEVIPELVNTRDNGYKSVDYAKLVSVLVEAVKEQQKQIEALEERINSIALKELDKESYGYIKTNINK